MCVVCLCTIRGVHRLDSLSDAIQKHRKRSTCGGVWLVTGSFSDGGWRRTESGAGPSEIYTVQLWTKTKVMC